MSRIHYTKPSITELEQRYVADAAAGDAHQLGLGVGGGLVVHAAQGQGVRVARDAGLGGCEGDAGGRELVGTVQAGERAALVAVRLGGDAKDPGKLGARELQD